MIRPLTLDVLICTHRPDGIARVAAMNPPVIPGVSYVVSWQEHEGFPIPKELTERGDFRILRFDGHGLSANRNNALDHTTADIVLIGDDDLIYSREGLEGVLRVMRDNPTVDYASFRYDGPDNKCYPSEECDISTPPKGFNTTSFEVALRRTGAVSRLRYNEMFGLGAPVLTAGEDDIFYLCARRAGIGMRFFPITIATHPGLTTGTRIAGKPGVMRASGAVIALSYPFSAFLRIPLKAWRLSRAGHTGFFTAIRHLTYGALYSVLKVRL